MENCMFLGHGMVPLKYGMEFQASALGQYLKHTMEARSDLLLFHGAEK